MTLDKTNPNNIAIRSRILYIDHSSGKKIAFTLLAQQEDTVKREQSRYAENMSAMDVGLLRQADEELFNLTSERTTMMNQVDEKRNELQCSSEDLRRMQGLVRDASNEPGGLPGGVPPRNRI